MAPQTPEHTATGMTDQPWAQTSFLGEDVHVVAPANPSRAVVDALGAADHAGDARTRRAALDRLAAQLTDQALKRGRTPVPKRIT